MPINRGPVDGCDPILSWLTSGQGPIEPGTVTEDVLCPSCGYAGEVRVEKDYSTCPACLVAFRSSPLRRIITCPNCDQAIGLSDLDRDRTILCPRCKYFLGSLLRSESSRRARSTDE
jgi:uncharacterized paraquat-inducible protein A